MSNLELNASNAQLPTRHHLLELAEAYGVASEFWEISGVRHEVCEETLAKVLAAMGADVTSDDNAHHSACARRDRNWYRPLPPCTVVDNERAGSLTVHVPHGADIRVWVKYEDGVTDQAGACDITLAQEEDFTEPRDIAGILTGQARFAIPAGLPLGYHTVYAQVTKVGGSDLQMLEHASLIVTPRRMNDSRLDARRGWGMMLQLYSVCSKESWGLGDLHDLTQLAQTFGRDGADFVLINPLHAGEPIGHMQPSPYLPVSRRFFNPIYIHPESIPEWQKLSPEIQESLSSAAESLRSGDAADICAESSPSGEAAGVTGQDSSSEGVGSAEPFALSEFRLIDRDAVWKVKRDALREIFEVGRSEQREQEFTAFKCEAGQGLEDFARWCALQDALQEKNLEGANAQAADVQSIPAEDVDFWAWLQWIMDEQLKAVQCAAKDAGMRYGICHDLAVGVHPCGADTWALREAFAHGMQVGAPPDYYSQQGQNWSQPPWNPVALEEMAYEPVRDMVRTIIRHAGALRLDHVMGLFRLYWIPEGNPASDGTYVYFDHEAMLGIVLLEAQRAGAIMIGEDLGTVEPWIRDVLHERGILGTSVFWFEKQGDGWPKQPWDYRTDVLATVDTHDLPPVAGYWSETHIDVRENLGLLTEPVENVRGAAAWERELVMRRLREHGLVGDVPSEQSIIEAIHAYVCHTPSRLVGVSLTDAVGDRRMQNQPGTDQEYPNWRVPLCDGDGAPVPVENIGTNPRYRSLVEKINQHLV